MKWNQANPRFRRPSNLKGARNSRKKTGLFSKAGAKFGDLWQGFSYRFKREPKFVDATGGGSPRWPFKWPKLKWLEKRFERRENPETVPGEIKPERKIGPSRKIIVIGLLLGLAGVGTWWGLKQYSDRPVIIKTVEDLPIQAETLPPVPVLPAGPYELRQTRLEGLPTKEVTLKEGSTLGKLVEELGLSSKGAGALILAALAKSETLNAVRPGTRLRAVWADAEKNELARVEYFPASGGRALLILPDGDDGFWPVNLASEPIVVRQAASGSVSSTLWEAGEEAGLDPNLIMTLTDIMASEVDFLSDIQKGDSFQVLYQREYRDSLPQGAAVVEMSRLTNKGQDYEFHRYVDSSGKAGYYDPNGRSNKKTFLVSPLQYNRISSGYSMGRMHPIHKVVRPHQGVDYAAPSGTPVSAVAAGVVAFSGWNGGYGQLVTIEHGKTYTTMYAHLSRISKSAKKGDKVSQGDVVGYVGATGTATGPHLDFRLKKNGAFIDPLPELGSQQGMLLDPSENQAFTLIVTRNRNILTSFLAVRAGN